MGRLVTAGVCVRVSEIVLGRHVVRKAAVDRTPGPQEEPEDRQRKRGSG